jgi:hypothetical protein
MKTGLILRSRAKRGVSKDEANSWFETAHARLLTIGRDTGTRFQTRRFA